MIFLKKYWSIIPLCFLGYLFIKSYIHSYNEEFIFDSEIQFVVGILFLIFFSITAYTSIKYYKRNRKYYELIPSLFGLVFIFCFFYMRNKYQKIDSSPIVLRANYDGDINGFTLEFRKDSTYKFFNYSVFGGKYLRGKYLIKDSIIILDKKEIDNVVKTNQLAIRKMSENYKGSDYKIVQIDNKHNLIEDQYFDFIINIDKR